MRVGLCSSVDRLDVDAMYPHGDAEAKKDDLVQGSAQCLVGCEAVSDRENNVLVYDIVSNFFQWMFFASRNDGIYKYKTCSIGCDGYFPTNRDQFEDLLNDIYSFVCMVITNKL